MNSYSLLIFLHILAATGLFAGWGIEAVIIRKLRTTDRIEEAQIVWHLLRKQLILGPVSMLVILATGIWMGMTRWGHQMWMMLAFVGMILIVIIGLSFSRRAMPRLKAIFAEANGLLPQSFYTTAALLTISLRLRVAIGIAILALMTLKPVF